MKRLLKYIICLLRLYLILVLTASSLILLRFIFRLLPQTGKAEESMDEYFGQGFCGNLQHKLWNLVENPNSSFAAKVCFHEVFILSSFTYHMVRITPGKSVVNLEQLTSVFQQFKSF